MFSYLSDEMIVKIYEGENYNVRQAVSTIVHESNHVDFRMRRRVKYNSQYEEFRGDVREEMYRNAADPELPVRPTLEKRYEIWEDIKKRYPELPLGKNPFGKLRSQDER